MNKKSILILGVILAFSFSNCNGQEPSRNSNEQNLPQKPQGQKGGPLSVEELFVKLDTNKDGKLSKKEVQGPLKKDFSKVDTNGDGFLSKEEIEAAPKPKQGQRPPR
tara:strand:+ start:5630 stop:5950 length:321 start_codon:yes stop_codon:yes gene_type:complete